MREDAEAVTYRGGARAPEADLAATRRQTAALMLLLLEERPDHGYGLSERVKPVINSFGRVYRSLHWLEEAGFVDGTWDTSNAGPARKVFQVTPSGRSALELVAPTLRRRAKAADDEESRLILRQLRTVLKARGTFEFTVATQLRVEASDEESARRKLERAFGRSHVVNDDVRAVGAVSIGPSGATGRHPGPDSP
jgi:DNA-binding PadR family transcriptional regulator